MIKFQFPFITSDFVIEEAHLHNNHYYSDVDEWLYGVELQPLDRHLEVAVSDAIYNNYAPGTPFIIPPNPGLNPVIPAGATQQSCVSFKDTSRSVHSSFPLQQYQCHKFRRSGGVKAVQSCR